jgi:hypothetical protein
MNGICRRGFLLALALVFAASPCAAQQTTGPAQVQGTASTTSTASTLLIAAPTPSTRRIYVTAFGCANTGATGAGIVFQDGSGGTTVWNTIAPAAGGSNQAGGGTPLFWTSPGNGLYFAAGAGSTTISCSASGFSSP